jgi:hypothetical protein
MNNDYLGFLYQVIDLEVISLGDGQWHRVHNFRRDSPTDRPDAGNGNGGTRQDMRENGTATHCSHEFSPCPIGSERCRRHDVCRVKSRGSLATLQFIQQPLYRGASNLRSSKFKSPCRSIGEYLRARQGFFLSTHTQGIGIIGR